MPRAAVGPLRVLSRTPGRLRIHLPETVGEEDGRRVEAALRGLSAVHGARWSPLTGNVLVHFDPRATSAAAVEQATQRCCESAGVPRTEAAPRGGRVVRGRALLRAGVRGLVGHALLDTAFYAVMFAEPFGLPLAGLGVLHLGLDVFAWMVALAPPAGALTSLPRPSLTGR